MEINSRTKIILVIIGFAIFAVFMFWLGYSILGSRTQSIADSITQRRIELGLLQREQKSFEEGKKDLAELNKSAYPPEDLFSRDTKVVKEIQQLESTAQKFGLEMSLSVSGTAESAVKVEGTAGELYAVPYTLTLTGPASNALLFMQSAEHLPFVTHVKDISISSVAEKTHTTISSVFYIKK